MGGAADMMGPGVETDVDLEIARTLWKNHKLIPPQSVFKARWDVMMIVFVMYNCVFIPFELCFAYDKHLIHAIFDYIIDVMFLIDMILSFRTTYYNTENELVLDRKLIRTRYLKSWFLLDLFAIFPFEVFAVGSDNLSVLGILKLPRLLRLGRVLKMMDKLSAANAIRIVYLLTFCVLISHWLACIWWLVGKLVYDYDVSHEEELHDGHGTSWLSRVEGNEVLDADSTLAMKYSTAWYWALTMLMKTPFVGPDALAEKVFASIAVVLGAIIFAALLGNVTALMQSFGVQDRLLREKIAATRNFCSRMQVPAHLEKKLGDYVDAHWTMSSGLDDLAVLSQLPGQLQGTIVQQMYRDTLLLTPLFKKCSKECSTQLLLRLRPIVCLNGETLIGSDAMITSVFVLMRGALQVNLVNEEKFLKEAGADGAAAGGGGTSTPPPRRPKCCADAPRDASSTSPTASFKGKFMPLEKQGQTIGGAELFDARGSRYPFDVVATKNSYLQYIAYSDIEGIISVFFGADASWLTKQLQSEHQIIEETLVGKEASQARRRMRSNSCGSVPASSPPKDSRDSERKETKSVEELKDQTVVVEQRLQRMKDDLGQIYTNLEALPLIAELLKEHGSIRMPAVQAPAVLPSPRSTC